jgi:ComF family protein
MPLTVTRNAIDRCLRRLLAIEQTLLPERCALCWMANTQRSNASNALCQACFESLPGLHLERCYVCAEPSMHSPCEQCQHEPPSFNASFAVCDYRDPIDHWVAQLKYGGQLGHATSFGHLMAHQLAAMFKLINTLDGAQSGAKFGSQAGAQAANEQLWTKPDYLVVVPISNQRFAHRGYNQSLALARVLSRQLNIKLLPSALIKTQHTVAQSTLNAQERAANLNHAFALGPQAKALTGKRVTVIDDVMTTGATLNAIAFLLKTQGQVEHVSNWVLARTPPPDFFTQNPLAHASQ